MSDTATLEPGNMTDAQYEAEIDRMLAEMKLMLAEMAESSRVAKARDAELSKRIDSMYAQAQALAARPL